MNPNRIKIIWSPFFRFPLFTIFLLIGFALSYLFPIISSKSDAGLVFQIIGQVSHGDFQNISNESFAYALACMIVSFAAGLAFAIYMMHVLAIQFSLWVARWELEQFKSPPEFQDKFHNISQALSEDKLIGHAWGEYAKTCVREKTVFATLRPQSFINPNIARERLFGLKLMPTIPGYFVGLGLLLTFIGLVIALSKAAGETAAASPEGMTQSLRELLDAAT